MADNYIKLAGLPEWFEWNPYTEEGRTLDRIVGAKCGSTRIRKGVDTLTWATDEGGRPHIQFSVDGKVITLRKHQLIWMAHHMRPIPKGYDIHHIDGDWTNNAIENLQLLTKEEHWKIHSKAVVAVDKHNNIVHRFASINEASRNGFNQGNVSKACRGCFNRDGNHKYKGLWWYYESEWLELQTL